MKRTALLLLTIIFVQFSYGQEFSFQMFLEDATGQKDTLVFGYDATATDSIDASFGENDISNEPFSDSFEARIIRFDYYENNFDLFMSGSASFHTKKQIKAKACSEEEFPLVSTVHLSNAQYPVRVSWESNLFENACLEQSLITDWHPGGWFDAVFGGEQGPLYMINHDTVEFSETTHKFISESNDTTGVLFFTMASVNNIISSIPDAETIEWFDVYPNPTSGLVYIESMKSEKEINHIALYNLAGKKRNIRRNNNALNLEALPEGIYFIVVEFDDGITLRKRILKQE